jgi:hypothetical protein
VITGGISKECRSRDGHHPRCIQRRKFLLVPHVAQNRGIEKEPPLNLRTANNLRAWDQKNKASTQNANAQNVRRRSIEDW